MARYAKNKGAKIIAVTDSPMSPFEDISDISFFISLNFLSFGESYTAAIAFLTVLCAEYSYRLPDNAVQRLQNYDECAVNLEFFEWSKIIHFYLFRLSNKKIMISFVT